MSELSGEDILARLLGDKPGAAPDTQAGEAILEKLLASKPGRTQAVAAFAPETAETRRIGDLMTPGPPTPSASQPPGNAVNLPFFSRPREMDTAQVGQAAREGYENSALVAPPGVALADRAGLGFIPRGLNMLSGAVGGATSGALNFGSQAMDAIVPGTGRDFGQGVPLAMPFMGQGPRLPMAEVNQLAARNAGSGAALMRDTPPRFISEIYAPPPTPGANPLDRITQLIRHDDAEIAANNGGLPENRLAAKATPEPAPPPSNQPIPNGLTPEQVAEFKNIPEALPPNDRPIRSPEDAEARADEIVRHFASIGNKTPIPGAEGALPTITGNSGLATLYRAVRDSDTPVPFTTLETASKTKAMGTLKEASGTADDLAHAKETRAETVKPLYDRAWANKGKADPSGPIQTVQDFMKSPAKQNDTVMGELPGILKKLQGETDPQQLKGIADNIDATLQRLGTEGKADRETRRVLGMVKESIMPAISDAAPGFDAAQAEFSRQSRRIDEMTYLQGRKLTDLQGNPTLGNMRSMLDDIAKKQAGDKFHPADSVKPETVETIRRLHDQMQREQLTATAGKALGSNTFQNLATNTRVGSLAGSVGNALAGGVVGGGIDLAAGHSGVAGMLVGNALGAGAKYYADRSAASAAARSEAGRQMLMEALRDRMLNIDNKGVRALSGPN
jgi:hypothetical protein